MDDLHIQNIYVLSWQVRICFSNMLMKLGLKVNESFDENHPDTFSEAVVVENNTRGRKW